MSYALAYTTHFRSLDNTLWDIGIYIDGYDARDVEIKLEGDEPCVIEWQETGKMDVVQSSKCTLRVSNESDRQMVQLINHPHAALLVSRDGKGYWMGYLDDAVYEEPYSFKKSYVTELTFTDFGILNRVPFTLTGKQSVLAIVRHCLESTAYGNAPHINLYTSLLEPKSGMPITLDMLYINADRFEAKDESWDAMTNKREVLEEILRPLGLRIMQKNGQIYIYDTEYLRDHNMYNYVVWKGTDAYLKGSETYGWYEVAFEHAAKENLANDGIDYDAYNWEMVESDIAPIEGPTVVPFLPNYLVGFYITSRPQAYPIPTVVIADRARFFRTEPVFTDSADMGVAWRIVCKRLVGYIPVGGEQHPMYSDAVQVGNHPAICVADTERVLSITTGYLPLAPERDKYQLRVNLDFLLSFQPNPIEPNPNDVPQYEGVWKRMNAFAFMVPVKLEVLNDNGTAVCHYKNAAASDIVNVSFPNDSLGIVSPRGIGNGVWVSGSASFGDMFLAYYQDYDPDADDRDPLVTKGWVGNRIALSGTNDINGTLYRVRTDGEYLPLPPVAGRLRFTVGNGVMPTGSLSPDNYWRMISSREHFRWQLYRNPQITLVRANRRNDGINTDPAYERDCINIQADHFSETVNAGTWQKGIVPSARGLLFDGVGNVWQKFTKNDTDATLQEHRLRCIKHQTANVQPVITGTAELDIQFCAKRENSTSGIFLVTALRQDLHQDTEHVTMARIAPVGGFVHEFAWSDPYCVEEEPYTFVWSSPVCAQEPGPYKFAWSNPTCVKQYIYFLEWEEMQSVIID